MSTVPHEACQPITQNHVSSACLKTRHSLPFFFRMHMNSADLPPELFLEIKCANRMSSGSQFRGHHGRDRWRDTTFLVQNDICTRPVSWPWTLFSSLFPIKNWLAESVGVQLYVTCALRQESLLYISISLDAASDDVSDTRLRHRGQMSFIVSCGNCTAGCSKHTHTLTHTTA